MLRPLLPLLSTEPGKSRWQCSAVAPCARAPLGPHEHLWGAALTEIRTWPGIRAAWPEGRREGWPRFNPHSLPCLFHLCSARYVLAGRAGDRMGTETGWVVSELQQQCSLRSFKMPWQLRPLCMPGWISLFPSTVHLYGIHGQGCCLEFLCWVFLFQKPGVMEFLLSFLTPAGFWNLLRYFGSVKWHRKIYAYISPSVPGLMYAYSVRAFI